MAHHVVIKRVPQLTRDKRVIKGKYTYQVKCKRCGQLHGEDARITSEGLAKLALVNHHIDVHNRHHEQHPADRAHLRTDRQKQGKMVKPRG